MENRQKPHLLPYLINVQYTLYAYALYSALHVVHCTVSGKRTFYEKTNLYLKPNYLRMHTQSIEQTASAL